MALPDVRVPIEADEQILRARRTAALTRVTMGTVGVCLSLLQPQLAVSQPLSIAGFTVIALTAGVQLAGPRLSWLSVEESLAASAGLLIVGLGDERVGILSLLWLTAIASGVLARGGRVHWLGRNLVLFSLLLPVLRHGSLSAEYAALCASVVGLLLTSGRLTRELNLLLRQARLETESAETLLLAGDIAARMGDLSERPVAARSRGQSDAGRASEVSSRGIAELERVIAGEDLKIAVQPIVDIRSSTIHAYEALARFECSGGERRPLSWFTLAEHHGLRNELERACLSAALALFPQRPAGTSLSVNLSAPALLDPATMAILQAIGERDGTSLDGLIIEITEETLVHGDMQLASTIAPLRERGARLAVDDMGAGYSGLRQITTVLPTYLKLDRSLITGIDGDGERAALLSALVGYSEQVDCLLVAEGIETEAELLAVRSLGVQLVQGFFLARPAAPWPQACADVHIAVDGAARGARPSANPSLLIPA